MKWPKIRALRDEPRRTALLMITDRCPVGCAHCSVDSRPDGPMITDHAWWSAMVDALCQRPGLELVGITGGEPFVERRGLQLAVERLTAEGLAIVVYTSGLWGRADPPAWIVDVLDRIDTLVLSTDAFHAPRLEPETVVLALREATARGCWVVVQTLGGASEQAAAVALLERALGHAWEQAAELVQVSLLPYGRASSLVDIAGSRHLEAFGACSMLQSPVIRYDGNVIACCNERVTMGAGPPRLRRRVSDPERLGLALDDLADDPFLQLMAAGGPAAVALHSRLEERASRACRSICEACWALAEAAPPAQDPLLRLMSLAASAQEHS